MKTEKQLEYQKKFGKRIADRRKQLGLSQEELAHKLGYKSRSTINKIELGINDIPQQKILEFSVALDMPIVELMAWEQVDSDSPIFEDTLEEELINTFRMLTAFNKGQVMGMIRGVLSAQEAEIQELSRSIG